MSVRLLDAVSDAIANRPRNMSYADIALHTKTSFAKVSRLARGKGEGVPVDEVQAIYEHVTGRPLIAHRGDV